MKVNTLVDAASDFVGSLSILPGMSTETTACIAKRPFVEKFREEIPSEGLSKKSGVYIFSNSDMDVLYIGKAGANNFAAEIYGKFKASTSDSGYFANSPMAKDAPDEGNLKELIRSGDTYIHSIEISPSEMTSLLEVYLQTFCVRFERKLPPINKQIG